jgi:hypothetical protein
VVCRKVVKDLLRNPVPWLFKLVFAVSGAMPGFLQAMLVLAIAINVLSL